MDINRDEREQLLAAEQNARRLLDESRAEAEETLHKANAEAIALLLREQDKAASLLFQQSGHAASLRHEAERTVAGGPEAVTALTEKEREAHELQEDQVRAAESLRVAESEAASILHGALSSATNDILMRGHREAAALLLNARMQIEVARTAESEARTVGAAKAR